MSEQKKIKINFKPEWFQSGYFVYIITIIHKDRGLFYYIGQTGDRKHISARSPFYRLIAHLRPYKSTDNQLANGLITHHLVIPTKEKSLRVCIEEAFTENTIEVYADYFKINDFDSKQHRIKTKFVESIEQSIIINMNNKGKRLFNNPKKYSLNKIEISPEAKKIAVQIIKSIRR